MLASHAYVLGHAQGVRAGCGDSLSRAVARMTSKSMLTALIALSAMSIVQVRYITKSTFMHVSKMDAQSRKLQNKIEYARGKKQHLLQLSGVLNAAKQRGLIKPGKNSIKLLGV